VLRRITVWVAAASALLGVPTTFVVATAGPAGAVTVSTAAQLRANFENPVVSEVVLANDISIDDDCGAGEIVRPEGATTAIVLDGAGFTITQTCNDRIFDLEDGDFPVTFRNVTLTGGLAASSGGAIDVDPETDDGGSVTIEDSTIIGNIACEDGGGIELDETSTLTVRRSTFTANQAADEGGAIDADEGDNIALYNSTVTGNKQVNDGAIALEPTEDTSESPIPSGGSLVLVYNTIVGNIHTDASPPECAVFDDALEAEPGDEPEVGTAETNEVGAQADGQPANISIDTGSPEDDDTGTPAFESFATVVARPEGIAPNCEIYDGATATSHGYNFSDDDTCAFTGTGDTQNGGDPVVGALGDNGGPTPTMLPLAGSPLIDRVPLAACQANGAAGITGDQRGVTRPQGSGCEIGSVELELVVLFTG
jgi:hypothetical protein